VIPIPRCVAEAKFLTFEFELGPKHQILLFCSSNRAAFVFSVAVSRSKITCELKVLKWRAENETQKKSPMDRPDYSE
jgi:hypothetical protein